MRATLTHEGDRLTLQTRLHPEDPVSGIGQGGMTVDMVARDVRFWFPEAIPEPHPDLLALTALLSVRPWIARRLVMDRPVSRTFAEAVDSVFGIDVTPVDDDLAPRAPGGTPLLSYSGGADSIAASLLLPQGIPHVHMRRVAHARIPNRGTHVRSDVMEGLVREAGERGRDVRIVRTDLEHLCRPYPTLAHWLAIVLGSVLMADVCDGGGIATGTPLEVGYVDTGRRWTGYTPATVDGLTAAVGLPLLRPVFGITEIGTMTLTAGSDLADLSRSCVLGTASRTCGVCAKCVRKDLVTATLDGGRAPESLRALTESAPAWRQLSGPTPLTMQATLEYALARVDLDGTILAQVRERLAPDAADTAWMTRAYRPALDDAMPRWRDEVEANLERKVGFMSEDDVRTMQAWSR